MQNQEIDVVSEFQYNSMNEDYNMDYRNWRQNTLSPYAYRYVGNPRERMFVEGRGETQLTPIAAERDVLTRVSNVIGLSLLVYLACELLGGMLLIVIMQAFGVDIHMDFLLLGMKGSQWSVMLTRAVVSIMKFGSAYLLMQRKFNLPHMIRIPMHNSGGPELLLTVGLAMGAACAYCLIDSATGGGRMLGDKIFDYKDTAAVVAYALFDVTVISIMSEGLLRGLMLPILRQFGDRFAVLMIAAIAFLMPNTLSERVGEFCVGLGAGYLLLKGGSFIKCVFLRMIYTAICYSRLILIYGEGAMISFWKFMLILLLTALVGVGSYLLLRLGPFGISNRFSYLPSKMKIMAFAETVLMLPWICISILVMLVQMFY